MRYINLRFTYLLNLTGLVIKAFQGPKFFTCPHKLIVFTNIHESQLWVYIINIMLRMPVDAVSNTGNIIGCVTWVEQCGHVVGRLIERQLVYCRLNTQAGQDVVPPHFIADTDRVVVIDSQHLGERLVDEDDGNEHSEALLSEASDVAHQEAQVEHDDHDQDDRQPEPDPEPQRHERYSIRTTTVQRESEVRLL